MRNLLPTLSRLRLISTLIGALALPLSQPLSAQTGLSLSGPGNVPGSPFGFGAQRAPAEPVTLDRVVAQVNEGVILLSQLRLEVRKVVAELKQQGGQIPPLSDIQSQVLEKLVMTELQLQAAKRAGITVGEKSVDQAMESIAQNNNMSLPQLRNTLINDGVDYLGFRDTVRQELTIRRIRQRRINNRLAVTPQEVERFMVSEIAKRDDIEYNVAHILVALPGEVDTDKLAEARAKAEEIVKRARNGEDFNALAIGNSNAENALKGGDLGWRTPTQIPSAFASSVPSMKIGEISDPIRSPSGLHIIKLLDIRHPQKTLVKQTHARHILIKTSEIVSNSQARARLERLSLRLEGGEDFTLLARANSDDTGSAIKGGDLGWFGKGEMVPAFEQMVASLKPGELSPPFKSPFGWHIVEVLERRTQDQTDELLRDEAREKLVKLRVEEKTEEWLRSLRDEAFIELKR